MDAFTNFLANNYVWFLIVSLILLLALIGYLVDAREMKVGKRKKHKEELKIVDFSTIDQSKGLNQSIKEEDSKSLNLDAYAQKMDSSKITNETPLASDVNVSNLDSQELETISLDEQMNSTVLDENEQQFESEFK